MYTVGDLIQNVDRKLHGGGTSQTQDFYGALDEARRIMVTEISPRELVTSEIIESAFYDNVHKYTVPADLKFKQVIDMSLLSSRNNFDTLERPLKQIYSKKLQSDRHPRNLFDVKYDKGVKYMDIGDLNLRKTNLVIDKMNKVQGWSVGGNIVNLQEDHLNYISGTGSLSAEINDSATEGVIQKTTLPSLDVFEFLKTGAVFVWVYMPKTIESVTLRLGSDSTNFYHNVVNQAHNNIEFIEGWNLLKFDFPKMQSTGMVNPRSITFVEIEVKSTIPVKTIRFDNIICQVGQVVKVDYNSNIMFRDVQTGAKKLRATSNTDLVMLEEDAFQILMLQLALIIQKEAYSNNGGAQSDINDIAPELYRAYERYKNENPSEHLFAEDSYWNF